MKIVLSVFSILCLFLNVQGMESARELKKIGEPFNRTQKASDSEDELAECAGAGRERDEAHKLQEVMRLLKGTLIESDSEAELNRYEDAGVGVTQDMKRVKIGGEVKESPVSILRSSESAAAAASDATQPLVQFPDGLTFTEFAALYSYTRSDTPAPRICGRRKRDSGSETPSDSRSSGRPSCSLSLDDIENEYSEGEEL